MSILLLNAQYINPSTFEINYCHIYVQEGIKGEIRFIPITSLTLPQADTVMDCAHKYVTSSFVCGHHHAYSALATGMYPPATSPKNFLETLRYIWWTLDVCLDTEMIEASALATAIACAKNGTTFVIDHHSSPTHIKGSLSVIASAFEKVGLSHLLCYEISDRNGENATKEAFEETEEYLSGQQGLVGLHASFTLSDNTLAYAANVMQKYKSGIHIHVAEDPADQKDCFKKYNINVVERLHNFGLLDSSKSILSHCLHIKDNERKIINNTPVWIAQNTDSNLNNKVGIFNGVEIQNRVMLGTDGMHSDMLKSAKSSFFIGQNYETLNYAETYRRFRNVNSYLQNNLFTGAGENNLVILDYNPPTIMNQNNFLSHFIFGIESKHIQHVISKGKLIVRDRQVVSIDEKSVMLHCQELSIQLWERMKLHKQ